MKSFGFFVVPSSNQVDLERLNNEILSRKRKHFQHGSAESERLITSAATTTTAAATTTTTAARLKQKLNGRDSSSFRSSDGSGWFVEKTNRRIRRPVNSKHDL